MSEETELQREVLRLERNMDSKQQHIDELEAQLEKVKRKLKIKSDGLDAAFKIGGWLAENLEELKESINE